MWSASPKKCPDVSLPVCARAAGFFVSACEQNVIMCGCLYVRSLLSAVHLSLYILVSVFERLFMYAEFAGAAAVKQSNFHRDFGFYRY